MAADYGRHSYYMMRSKYNVSDDKSRRSYNDIIFDSEAEMKYYRDVIIPLLQNGEIAVCEMQKTYILQPKFKHDNKTIQPITYVADFYLEYSDGKKIVIDVKGFHDQKSAIKRKMFWYVYPDIPLLWYGYSKIDGGWLLCEDIAKHRATRKKAKKKENKE